jgi:hypothetical protein
VGQVVDVPDVVALELEARAMGAQGLENAFDIGERVAEDVPARHLEIARLPVVRELLDAVGHGVEPKVHRPHVEGAHLRLHAQGSGQAVVDGHRLRPAGSDIDDRVGLRFDARQELQENVGIGRRLPGVGIAGVEMEDGRPFLRRADGVVGYLLGRDRESVRL